MANEWRKVQDAAQGAVGRELGLTVRLGYAERKNKELQDAILKRDTELKKVYSNLYQAESKLRRHRLTNCRSTARKSTFYIPPDRTAASSSHLPIIRLLDTVNTLATRARIEGNEYIVQKEQPEEDEDEEPISEFETTPVQKTVPPPAPQQVEPMQDIEEDEEEDPEMMEEEDAETEEEAGEKPFEVIEISSDEDKEEYALADFVDLTGDDDEW